MTSGDPDAGLAEELNSFFARFESPTQLPATLLQAPPASSTPPPMTLEVQGVTRVLRSVNSTKATGPDGVPGAEGLRYRSIRVLSQLAAILRCHISKEAWRGQSSCLTSFVMRVNTGVLI